MLRNGLLPEECRGELSCAAAISKLRHALVRGMVWELQQIRFSPASVRFGTISVGGTWVGLDRIYREGSFGESDRKTPWQQENIFTKLGLDKGEVNSMFL